VASTAAAGTDERARRRYRRRRRAFPYLLLIPPAALVLALFAYPLYLAIDMSLREGRSFNIDRIRQQPLTFAHYVDVFAAPEMLHTLWVTAVYTLGSTALCFVIGLGTALLLNRKFPARRLLRTAILTPWAVPGAVAAMVFLFMLDGSYGVVNWLLERIGLLDKPIAWYFDRDTALFAVIVPTVWKGYPFFTIVLIAALQTIPTDLYEAARVDGAGILAQFRSITWPGIRSTSVLALILNGLWAFHVFDFIYPLTGGGPDGATETWAIRIYNEGFGFFHPGTAAALGVVATLLAIVVVLAVFPVMRREFF
jgi:multiple sugar transport system permease protein